MLRQMRLMEDRRRSISCPVWVFSWSGMSSSSELAKALVLSLSQTVCTMGKTSLTQIVDRPLIAKRNEGHVVFRGQL